MMNNTTVDSQEVAKFSELAAQWWDTEGPFKTLHDLNATRIEFIQSKVTLQKKRFLDVGCGGGILAEGLAALGANVTGLDASKEVIAAAKAHAQAQEVHIRYVAKSLEAFKARPFDVITCMEMLEHVSQPEVIMMEAARLLKPGGYLFLSTLNRTVSAFTGAIIAAEYLLNILPRQTHDYKKFIKPSELAAMVRQAGMEVVALSGLSYNPFKRTAVLQQSVRMNYLMACRKPEYHVS